MKVKRKIDGMIGTARDIMSTSHDGSKYSVLWTDESHSYIPCRDVAIIGVPSYMKKIVALFMNRDGDTIIDAVDQAMQLLDEAYEIANTGDSHFASYEEMTSLLREYGLDEDYMDRIVESLIAYKPLTN